MWMLYVFGIFLSVGESFQECKYDNTVFCGQSCRARSGYLETGETCRYGVCCKAVNCTNGFCVTTEELALLGSRVRVDRNGFCGTTEVCALPASTTTTTAAFEPKPRGCGVKGSYGKRSVGEIDLVKRIVGGTNADKCEYPWQVSLQVKDYVCGGSIIDEDTIITAAHCLEGGVKVSQITLDVGEYSLYDDLDQTTVGVKDFTLHPKYNDITFQNDIAIIKLRNPLKFNRCVSPICLPSSNQNFMNKDCDITGWGATKDGGNVSPILQKVTISVKDLSECQRVFGKMFVTNLNICAGFTKGGKDSCQGDSGGPLACPSGGKYVLAGVVSWGDGCGAEKRPGIYTDVSKFISWIAKNS